MNSVPGQKVSRIVISWAISPRCIAGKILNLSDTVRNKGGKLLITLNPVEDDLTDQRCSGMACNDKELTINLLTLLASTAAISSNLGKVKVFTGAIRDLAIMKFTLSPAVR